MTATNASDENNEDPQIQTWREQGSVAYNAIVWIGLKEAALRWYPDEDLHGATRRIRGWKDDKGTDETEFQPGLIRRKREGTAANSPWSVAAQDLALFTEGRAVNEKPKTTAVEMTEMWDRFYEFTSKIEKLAEDKGKAEGIRDFLSGQVLPEKNTQITELKEETAQLKAEKDKIEEERDRLRAELEERTSTETDVIDLRKEPQPESGEQKVGFFKRVFSGKIAPVV